MGAKIVFDLYDIYLDNILKVFSVHIDSVRCLIFPVPLTIIIEN